MGVGIYTCELSWVILGLAKGNPMGLEQVVCGRKPDKSLDSGTLYALGSLEDEE